MRYLLLILLSYNSLSYAQQYAQGSWKIETGQIKFWSGSQWETVPPNGSCNAATATALENARTINGVSFNGTANITVTAATLTTPRSIYGNNFDGSAALSQVIGSAFGGTGNGFTKFTGPTTSEKTFTLPNSSATILTDAAGVTNAQLAGSIDLATKVTGILPFASNAGTSAATSATTGTMTVNMTTRIITITPTNACTFNGSGGVTGQTSTFVITTSGTSSFVLTWGTNYKTTSTLATGTVSAKIFAVTFLCTNGTQWIEISRTAAM